MAQVVLENVEKVYPGGVQAVKNANLVIDDKEFVVLVGPSGCGKSTTLRMIAGLEEISSGQIYIDEQLVNYIPPKKRDIAMVFQNYALYPHMTVYENLAFGMKLRNYHKSDIHQRVEEAADILDIGELLERKPSALSGGQRQRVAVGRAIVRKPKVFLFDEPLSNLDAKLRVQMRTEISKLHTRLATTMIYVTHDQVEAMTMGDRIVVMKDGYIQQEASPLELYNRPANLFVAGFIGSPPMNFFTGHIATQGGIPTFVGDNFSLAADTLHRDHLLPFADKPVVMGIRPEDIQDRLFTSIPQAHEALQAHIEVVEPMGSETILYLCSGKSSFVARVDSHHPARANEQVDMVFDMKKAHFFDAQSTETIV